MSDGQDADEPVAAGTDDNDAFLEWLKGRAGPTGALPAGHQRAREVPEGGGEAFLAAGGRSGGCLRLRRVRSWTGERAGCQPDPCAPTDQGGKAGPIPGQAGKAAIVGSPERRRMMATNEEEDKAGTTLLTLVVDRSGSMEPIKDDMEGGIKTLIEEQAKEEGDVPGHARAVRRPLRGGRRRRAGRRTAAVSARPRGMTALLDAIGRTIAMVHARIEDMDAADRPQQHVVRRHHRRLGERQQGVDPAAGDGLGQGPDRRGLALHVPGRGPGCRPGRTRSGCPGRGVVDVRQVVSGCHRRHDLDGSEDTGSCARQRHRTSSTRRPSARPPRETDPTGGPRDARSHVSPRYR